MWCLVNLTGDVEELAHAIILIVATRLILTVKETKILFCDQHRCCHYVRTTINCEQ